MSILEEPSSSKRRIVASQADEKRLILMDIYGTDLKSIQEKQHTPFVGISLGNRFFVEKRRNIHEPNVKAYIKWALAHTKSRIAVFIPDMLEAINIEYMNKRDDGKSRYKPERARQIAQESGEFITDQIAQIRDTLPLVQADAIDIIRWKDVADNSEKYNINFLYIESFFLERGDFYREVRSIVAHFIQKAGKNIEEERQEQLCYYFLREFAILVGGLEYEDTVFDLFPYPEMGLAQKLAIDIQNGTKYPILGRQLIIRGKLAAVALQPLCVSLV